MLRTKHQTLREQQAHEYDMKSILSHADAKNEPSIMIETLENKEEAIMDLYFQNPTFEDPFCTSSLYEDFYFPSVWQETELGDDSMWVNLWDQQLDA